MRKNIRVLVVDDSIFMRRIITDILKSDAQIEVVGTASNGREAIEKAIQLNPDVITLDIEMPVMDGLSCLKELQRKKDYSVVMLSSLTREGEKADHLTIQGFKEYLVFHDQNQLLKDKFVISEQVDLGLWHTKIIFDYRNKLFCMSKNQDKDKTVFEGKHLKSFTIKEDNALLFEGLAEGIRRYASTVPEQFIGFGTAQAVHTASAPITYAVNY
jgi:CheY-like chemotaxis protein